MKLEIFNNYEALSQKTAQIVIDTVTENPKSVLCLATGDSPLLTYQFVVKSMHEKQVDFSQVQFVGLDEWVGIPPTNPGSCKYYLNKHLFKPMDISPSHVHLFDGLSQRLDKECEKMDALLQRLGGIDLMVAGIGVNGHVGFNEPGVSSNLYAHVIELEEVTRTVGQKYFGEETRLAKGITLGLQYFMEARIALLVANGQKKAAIIKKILEGPISEKVPASLVRRHKNSLIFIDKDASTELSHSALDH